MTNQEIIKKYYSKSIRNIYAYTYASENQRYGEIIKINKNNLKINNFGNAFLYMWGWPGPDYNVYSFKDYGYTWAFNKKELIISE